MRIMTQSAKNKQVERANQCTFVRWFKMSHPGFKRLISAYVVTNKGIRAQGEGAWRGQMAKDEGLLAGYPDVFIAVPNGAHHGLYIEFKAIYETGKKGQLSEEQKLVHADLRLMNYQVNVCYSSDEAIQVWKDYFKGYFGTRESLV